jgi:branched-chain amino acid transport system substrate-binding protein
MQRGRGTAIVVVVLLLLLTALVAACGGDETTTTQASTATTQATSTTGATPTSGGATPPSSEAGSGEPIKVGMIVSLTGPAAAPCASVMNAVQLEVDAINAAGGVNGRLIELAIEDDGSELQKATAAATKLIEQTKVSAILGPFPPYSVGAVREIAEKAQVPEIVYMAPTKGDLATPGKWSFFVAQSITYNAQAMMEIFQQANLKKILVISDSLPTSSDHIGYVQELAKAAGGPELIVMSDTWNDGDPDVSAIITKIADQMKKVQPDGLLLLSNVVHFPIITKGLKSLGFDLPVIGEPSNNIPATIGMQGPDAVQGVMAPSAGLTNAAEIPADWPGKALLMDITDRYTKKYEMGPDFFAGMAYDAVHVLYQGLMAGGDDRAKIRDGIEAIKSWQGATGMFTYTPDDHIGVHDGYFIFKIDGGQFKYVATVTPEVTK